MGTGDAGRSGIEIFPPRHRKGRPARVRTPWQAAQQKSIHVVLLVVHVGLAVGAIRRGSLITVLSGRTMAASLLAAEPKRWISMTAPSCPSSALNPARSSGCRVMRHAPRAAWQADPSALAAESQQLSWPHAAQRSLRKPCARMPHSRTASNSSLMTWGGSAPVLASVCATRLAARCSTRQYSVVCSGRWRS